MLSVINIAGFEKKSNYPTFKSTLRQQNRLCKHFVLRLKQ